MKKKKDYHINIFYSEEDGGYIADIPDLDSCSAFGKTPEEGLEQVQVAKNAKYLSTPLTTIRREWFPASVAETFAPGRTASGQRPGRWAGSQDRRVAPFT